MLLFFATKDHFWSANLIWSANSAHPFAQQSSPLRGPFSLLKGGSLHGKPVKKEGRASKHTSELLLSLMPLPLSSSNLLRQLSSGHRTFFQVVGLIGEALVRQLSPSTADPHNQINTPNARNLPQSGLRPGGVRRQLLQNSRPASGAKPHPKGGSKKFKLLSLSSRLGDPRTLCQNTSRHHPGRIRSAGKECRQSGLHYHPFRGITTRATRPPTQVKEQCRPNILES